MAFNINTFHSEIDAGHGVMRDNLFEFVITRGGGLSRYWADSVNFPGKLNATSDVRRYGYGVVEKRPYVTNFMQCVAQFHNDNNNYVWSFLNDWMEQVIPNNMSSGMNSSQMLVAYKRDYQLDISINVYDSAGFLRNIIDMQQAFPTQISEVPLSWQNKDSPFIFTCNFDFLTWNTRAFDGDYSPPQGPVPPLPVPNQPPLPDPLG